MKKINKKVPGVLPPPPKSEIDGKITDLSSKTLPQLLEIRGRQAKLLNNKAFLNKLADRGEKIKATYDKIEKEIKIRQDEQKACDLLSSLKINPYDNQSIQNIEWDGKMKTQRETYLDSDDDSEPEDVLHILSQSTAQEKKVKVIPPDKPLLTPQDLMDIGDMPHVKYIVEKTEKNPVTTKQSGQFKPYKTTKSDVHNPEKESQRRKHKHWEVTAATPPPSVCGPVKVMSLEESLKLQQEHNLQLKRVEAQHAAEKLLARTGIKMEEVPSDMSQFGKYRDVDSDDSEDSDLEQSDKEVHDEEPERGGVVFTVMK